MPGMSSGYEKLSRMRYQIVMTISLLGNRPCLGVVSPAFALICQYLSSAVRDLAPSTLYPHRRKIHLASSSV